MKASRSEGRISSWRVVSRAAVWLAAAFVIITSGVRSAAAGPSPAVPSDVQALAVQLAANAQRDAGGSCDAGFSAAPQFGVFPGGGVTAAKQIGGPAVHTGELQVMCALPFTTGRPGGDCTGKHNLQWQVLNASSNAKVTTELMALAADGTLMKSFTVFNGVHTAGAATVTGGTAQLASRMLAKDWKFVSGKNKDYTIFAPVPLMKVTVEDQGEKAVAFCSDIPWVDVIEPSGGVITEDSGGSMDVLAAIPRTNAGQIQLLVDNVNVLQPGAGVVTTTPAECNAHTPCNGTVGGVTVSDVIVDVAPGIGTLSSNTIRATLAFDPLLSCGGHFVRVSTTQNALKVPSSEQCVMDDLTDLGRFSVFAINITAPVGGSVVAAGDTVVTGSVCSGTEIVDVNINGKSLNSLLGGQSFTPGVGETSGDVYTFVIDTMLPPSDLENELIVKANPTSLGTFDAGSNRLVASARETLGARAYKRVVFATGDVAVIGTLGPITAIVGGANESVFQQAALQNTINTQVQALLEGRVQKVMAGTSTALENAFIVGLSDNGTQTLFTKLCTTPILFEGSMLTPGQIFQKKVKESIEAIDDAGISISPSVPCAPDPDVELTITNVTVGDQISCVVDFNDGNFVVTMGLPDIHVDVHAFGHAEDEDPVFGGCLAGVTVSGDAYSDITDITLEFTVTEDNLLNNTFSSANFDGGVTLSSNGTVSVDFCGVSVFCDVIVTIFTLGAVDLTDIDFDISQNVDFSDAVGANQPDPVKLKEIKVDEQVVASFDQQVSGLVSSVRITPDGISAGLGGSFATMVVDTDVEDMPGITLTPQTVPTMGVLQNQGALDALVGLSDDAINMMFASLTAAGNLKAGADPQGCFPTGVNVGSLLPTEIAGGCDSLDFGVGNELATAGARGYCHAIKGDNCNTLAFGADGFLTSTERGVCHGASGSICTDVFAGDLVNLGACLITPNFNLKADMPLLFCAKGDVPPRMLFPSSAVSNQVPVALRLNDLTVSLVIDRTKNGAINGLLKDAPSCFAGGASNAVDCNVFAACLDINLNFLMTNITCETPGEASKPGFSAGLDPVNGVQIVTRELGVVCSGATSPTTDEDVLANASKEDTITIPLGNNAASFAPAICGAGLDLGGFVSCSSPQILAIEAGGSTVLRDYLSVTCTIQ